MDFSELIAQAILLTRSEAIIAADRDGVIRLWIRALNASSGMPAAKRLDARSTSSFRNGCGSDTGMAFAKSW